MTAADWISDRRTLIDAATEGPWYYGTPDDGCERTISEWMTLCAKGPDAPAANTLWTVWIDGVIIPAITGDGPKSQHNAALIADARTSLPAALDALEAVLELTDDWTKRGERLMASSVALPGDAGTPLLEAGADFVDKARRVRSVVTAALGIEVAS